MPLTPLAPATPQTGTGRRWSVAGSAALHLLALALVIGIASRRPPPPEPAGEPSYDLVFQGSGAPSAALPQAQPADVPMPEDSPIGPPAPAAEAPPIPDGATTPLPPAPNQEPSPSAANAEASPPPPPPVPSPATAQTAATTPAEAPPPPATAPPPPAPAQVSAPTQLTFAPPTDLAETPDPAPVQIQPTPAPPTVRLEQPPETEPTQQALAPIMPAPPPPLPPAPTPPRPRTPPRQAFGTLSNPMDLSFGSAAPRPMARSAVASRSIDLSPPRERDGPSSSDTYADIRAANASADWNRGLLQYWLRHRYYPHQAAEDGEEGTVTIQLTVNRSGRVEDVSVLSRSGSAWLDMAAVGTFRGAQLMPFTNEMREDRLTFPVPIHYILIRH